MDLDFLVIGAANLDILARKNGVDNVTDAQGVATVSVGGTACNIAINLASMKASVALASALSTSPFSDMIVRFIEQAGVTSLIERNQVLGESVFSAHLDIGGDLDVAVSCCAVEDHEFSRVYLQEHIQNAKGVVCDCNLSERQLLIIVEICKQLERPVYIAGVSESKAMRAFEISHASALFMNQREAEYCLSMIGVPDDSQEAYLRARAVPTVITMGTEGADLYIEGVHQHIPPPSLRNDAHSCLGAGDAFAAATIFHHCLGALPLQMAAACATDSAARAVEQTHCNLSLPSLFKSTMHEFHSLLHNDSVDGVMSRQSGYSHINFYLKMPSQAVTLVLIHLEGLHHVMAHGGRIAEEEVILQVCSALEDAGTTGYTLIRLSDDALGLFAPTPLDDSTTMMIERIRSAITERADALGVDVHPLIGIATRVPDDSAAFLVSRAFASRRSSPYVDLG